MPLEHGFRLDDQATDIERRISYQSADTDIENRICWVCFLSDAERDDQDTWCHPCECRGSTKWVHQSCLQRWIDSKQISTDSSNVACKACGFEYVIIYPKPSPMCALLESVQSSLNLLNKYLIGTATVGSVYWNSMGFGMFTVFQFCGTRDGVQLIAKQDLLSSLLILPAIPFVIFFSKMINWRPLATTFYRRVLLNIYPLSLLKPKDVPSWRLKDYYDSNTWFLKPSGLMDAISATITFPTMANVTGNLLFSNYDSPIKRSILGGLLYITAKGLLDIACDEMKFDQACKRQVQDH